MACKKVRLALIGTSGIARAHIVAINTNINAELVSIYSRDYRRAQDWANTYASSAAQSLDEIFLDPTIDGIVIATEPARHLDYALLALENQKHILIEKPIDFDLERSLDFLRRTRDTETIVSVVSQKRFDPELISLRENVLHGVIGTPITVSAELYWKRNLEYYQKGTKWRGDYGSVLLNQGIHWIDYALWIFGAPARVQGLNKSIRDGIQCSDTAILCVEFENGPLFTLQCSTAVDRSEAEFFIVRGTRGVLSWSSRSSWPVDYAKRAVRLIRGARSNLERQVDDFVRCILEGEQPVVSIENAVATLRVIKQCEEVHPSG